MEYVLTKNNCDELVTNKKGIPLVDFWASWCGPCQMQAPVIEELAYELDDVVIGKVNVDEQPELAMQFNISSIPTLIIFMDGRCVSTQVGYHSKRDLMMLINQFRK